VLRGVELIRARAVPRPGTTGLSDNDLRRQIRVRLATGRLPSVEGVSQSHRGTGRPCIVCRRVVERTDVEREVTGRSGAVLIAHEACYKPWREESRVWRDLVALGESAERSGVMDSAEVDVRRCPTCGRDRASEQKQEGGQTRVHYECRACQPAAAVAGGNGG
jgi:hypothetical protein